MHMKIVDLHVHSNKSDGTCSPSELLDLAIQKGLSAFALTDHDTTAGLDEAIEYAKGRDIEVVPGIEFSTEYQGRDIHVLGLAIDYKAPVFADRLQAFVDSGDLVGGGCAPFTPEEMEGFLQAARPFFQSVALRGL